MGYAVIAASVLLAAGFVLYDRHRTQRILENSTGQGTERISLQDVFWLINVFEADMNWHLSYDDAARWEENQTFVTGYTDIQDAFFRMLEESGCLTRQELTERFFRYALVIQEADGSYRRNCGLAFMSGEDRNFLSEFMLTNRIAYLTRNVRSYAQEGAF